MSRPKNKKIKVKNVDAELRQLLSKGFVLNLETDTLLLFTGQAQEVYQIDLTPSMTRAFDIALHTIHADNWDYKTYWGFWFMPPSRVDTATSH